MTPPFMPDDPNPIGSTAARGAAAGLVASVVQVIAGKVEDKLLLPTHEDADIAAALVDRWLRPLMP